jgi:hypothetical protein
MKGRIAVEVASLVCTVLLGAGMAGPALAQSSPAQMLLDDKIVFDIGAFVLNTDLKAGLNGQSASNPDVDFNQVFGKDDNATRIRADLLWRITPTQHVRFMYFDNTRNASRTLDQQITWGDNTYDVGANVNLQTKYNIYELAYEYAFLRRPDYELAFSAGVHFTDMRIRLSGTASSTDSEGNVTQVSGATSSRSLPAPLPVIGLRGGWAVSEHWYIDGLAQYFQAKVDGYDGHLSDLRVGATWMYNQNFGVGVGYNRFSTNLNVNRSSFDGNLNFGYSGLLVYLTGAF